MVARSLHRGHKIWFDESSQLWRYEDDDLAVKDNWTARPCNKCGESFTKDGHDPCIANLPCVMNACCGHGDDSSAYVQFKSGESIHGTEAILKQRELRKLSR